MVSTTKIIFSRHGESHANILHEISNRGLKHGLTPQGRQQANGLATQLLGQSITRIYSSPVLRAIETSVIVANRLSLDYEVTEALREIDHGILEGRSDETAWKMMKQLSDDWLLSQRWEQRIEGGENFHEVQKRFVSFIEGLVHQCRDTNETILCVAHGGLYTMTLPSVVVNINRDLIARYGIDYTTCIVTEQRAEGLVCFDWNGIKI